MRIALIADVHSNLVALEAVMKDIKAHSCDITLFLGDAVGYGPWPRETVALLRDADVSGVMGNHDAAVLGVFSLFGSNDETQEMIEWTKDAIFGEEYDWLDSLPYTQTVQNLLLSHGAPDYPERFEYVFTANDIERLDMAYIDVRQLICMGHNHEQWFFEQEEDGYVTREFASGDEFQLYPEMQYFCTVGSVGQPRDHDPMAAWVLYDTETNVLSFKRIDYDIEKVVKEFKAKGLPDILADRLWSGQ